MSANDDMVSAEEAFGGWPGINLGDGDAEEPVQQTETPPAAEPEAPTEDAPADPGRAVQDEGTPPAEPEQPAWQRYGFKDADAMWNSYQELQREFHARNGQPAPGDQPAEEEEEQPPTWRSHNFASLGEIPRVGLSAQQRTELSDLMQVDPKAAALWAHQNREYMEAPDFKAVQNHWAQNDPEEYWEFKNAIQQFQQDQQFQQTQASSQEWVLTQQREHAINSAKEALPLMDEKSEEFGDWLAAPENQAVSQMLDSIQDPDRLRQALVSAFYQYAGPTLYQDLVTSHAQAAQTEADRVAAEQAASKGRGARTQQRTQTTAPTGAAEDADQAIRDLILNPGGRR